jgi:hypothetical protein
LHSRDGDAGSGTETTWFGATGVFLNQNAAIWFSTWPLNGIVPTTTSKHEIRSLATSVRRAPST